MKAPGASSEQENRSQYIHIYIYIHVWVLLPPIYICVVIGKSGPSNPEQMGRCPNNHGVVFPFQDSSRVQAEILLRETLWRPKPGGQSWRRIPSESALEADLIARAKTQKY